MARPSATNKKNAALGTGFAQSDTQSAGQMQPVSSQRIISCQLYKTNQIFYVLLSVLRWLNKTSFAFHWNWKSDTIRNIFFAMTVLHISDSLLVTWLVTREYEWEWQHTTLRFSIKMKCNVSTFTLLSTFSSRISSILQLETAIIINNL